jgi:SAM-dependent methyltransferase
MQHAGVLAPGDEVLELGAGDGRTLRALAASHGIRGTAVDFSPAAVQRARDAARDAGGTVTAICADVRTWQPETTYDAVIVTFVQLLPAERRALFACMRSAVRPGGWVLGQWFRPAHLRGGYDRIGPNRPDRMVPLNELRAAFHDFDPLMVAGSTVTLDEGFLHGRAATAHLAARRPGG